MSRLRNRFQSNLDDIVGTVTLSNEEYEEMNLETAEEPLTRQRFVIPQVFHNLHCLVSSPHHCFKDLYYGITT